MAKLSKIKNPDCSADVRAGAGAVLRKGLKKTVKRRAAALDFTDAEGVHDMRVAVRRMRSALRDFAPFLKKRPRRKIKKNLKNLADALGAVRDRDVEIAALERFEAEQRAVKKELCRLIEECRIARGAAQTALTEKLADSAFEDWRKKVRAQIEKATAAGKSDERTSFEDAGRAALADLLQKFGEQSAATGEAFNAEALHDLRIAAKRLRYALELFESCFGKKAAEFAGEIAEMQNYLGEVHDADVQIASLQRRLSETGARKTCEWLLAKFFSARDENFRFAVNLQTKWKDEGFGERLRTMIEK